MLVLTDIFSAAEAKVLAEAAEALDFEDGRRSAGRIARSVKANRQAVASAERDAIFEKVRTSLWANPVFQAAACPAGFAAMLISRTEGGGHYGDHVDNALMSGGRADLSFTLFLSEPGQYRGGDLVIVDRVEDRHFRLGRGELILYPSDTLHRVEPVTTGVRLAVVGWVTSRVRDAGRRDILFDLDIAIRSAEAAEDQGQLTLLAKMRSNLFRMWAD